MEWHGDAQRRNGQRPRRAEAEQASSGGIRARSRHSSRYEDPARRRKLLALVPDYRLSKFQRVLPDQYQTEMIGEYLLDFEGAAEFFEAALKQARVLELTGTSARAQTRSSAIL